MNLSTRPSSRADRGFTLIEVAGALAILAAGLLTVALVRNQTLRGAVDAERHLTAVRLAEQKLGEFEVHGYPESETGGSFPNETGYSWQVLVSRVSVALKASVYRVDLAVVYPRIRGEDGTLVITTCYAQ